MRNFNSRFDRTLKMTGAFFIFVWVLVVLCNLGLAGGAVYVIWHFVSKHW
jgi:hypothetical protein